MEGARKSSNKIVEIVRLRGMLKRWKNEAGSRKNSSEKKGDGLPRGFLYVCVGEEMKRFVIPTAHLGHTSFVSLLKDAEEEFGFQHEGVLRIPCSVSFFEEILELVDSEKRKKKRKKDKDCSTEATPLYRFRQQSQKPVSC
ncbi:indole-3-acetic acid-induced protein ARG7-like [Wolffia australiana]